MSLQPVAPDQRGMFSSYGFYGLHANNCGTYLYHFWQHKKILKANDLPTDLNVHSLRYTAASLFIASGTDVGTVAGLPDHSQPMTALDIYTTPLIRTRKRTVRSCRAAWKSENVVPVCTNGANRDDFSLRIVRL